MAVEFKYHDPTPLDQLELDSRHLGRCHCGEVVFSIRGHRELDRFNRCNCSLCRRRGTVMGFVELDDFVIEAGEDRLTLYQFNTQTAKHYFCSQCGVYTHHQRRSVPTEYAFNVGCLDGVDPFALAHAAIIDGSRRHPCDH